MSNKNEYEIGQMKNQQRGGMMGRGPGGPIRAGEKPKDFKKSWGKLPPLQPQLSADHDYCHSLCCWRVDRLVGRTGPAQRYHKPH